MPPMPGRNNARNHGPVNFKAINKTTVRRLLGYLMEKKFAFLLVLACIAANSICTVLGTTMLQTVIDDYIVPLMVEASPVLTGLLRVIVKMGCIYLIAVLATLLQGILMARIGQSVLKRIRDEMFAHMQTLPIRYFDTHTFGDVMSHYTNDADTLRQMISMSIPQVLSSIITVASAFVAMIATSPILTVFILLTLLVMLWITKKVGGNNVFFVSDKALVACLDPAAKMTTDFFIEIAKRKPGIAFFRDDAFAADSARPNLQQAFDQFSPTTSIKVI